MRSILLCLSWLRANARGGWQDMPVYELGKLLIPDRHAKGWPIAQVGETARIARGSMQAFASSTMTVCYSNPPTSPSVERAGTLLRATSLKQRDTKIEPRASGHEPRASNIEPRSSSHNSRAVRHSPLASSIEPRAPKLLDCSTRLLDSLFS